VALPSVVKTPHLPRNLLFQRGHVGLRGQSGFLRFQANGQGDFARDTTNILEHRIESAVFIFFLMSELAENFGRRGEHGIDHPAGAGSDQAETDTRKDKRVVALSDPHRSTTGHDR
jgi:hypothetical protein